jgi:alkylation response protein AidB-like acyl-CoA dehydrogenase
MNFEPSDEMKLFRSTVHEWVDHEAPKAYTRDLERQEDEYPFELWDKLSAAGFHAVGISEEYGGQGGDVITQMILARELARSLAGLTWIWGLTSFAGGKSVGLYGSDTQKERFLPAIAAGESRWSIAFTEPGGGTDLLGGMRTSGTRVDGGWLLNGNKTWSTSAQVADYLLTIARTEPAGAKQHEGVTLFMVPRESDGVVVSPLAKLGLRSIGSCDIGFDDVFVPDELVLGEPGRAWYMLLPTLNNERIMLGAFCLGILDGVLEDAIAFSQERSAFGRTIAHFQAIQHFIADIAMARHQSDLVVNQAAWLQSEGKDCYRETTMAKVIASEAAVNAADTGIQILGGMGYSAETDMQRYWRDARLFRIGPITNEMARNVIAESYGLPRSF